MSDFSDRQFHVGSLVGLRAFSVDALGRLTGPSYGGIFKPGVNEAECKKRDEEYALTLGATYYYPKWTWFPAAPADPTAPTAAEITASAPLSEAAVESRQVETKPKHALAGPGCHCGFYAYFDGLNDYMHVGRIAAVVEGFGAYMLGTRGYRSSKMRLLGLITPPFGRTESSTFYSGKSEVMSPALLARVVSNYADVPVYENQAAAIEAHPLHEPEVPTPDTDPEFWTRSA